MSAIKYANLRYFFSCINRITEPQQPSGCAELYNEMNVSSASYRTQPIALRGRGYSYCRGGVLIVFDCGAAG